MTQSFRWQARGPGAALAGMTLILSILLLSPLAAQAQFYDDPNGSVARLSVASGDVAVQRGDSPDPVGAAVNAPILGGDSVSTGSGSRAEVQFDGSSMLRMGENSQARFNRLDNGNRDIQLAEGMADLRLFRGTDGTTNIDTPSIVVRPETGGSYLVDVTNDGATRVTVRSGRADIITPQGTRTLGPGGTLIATGDPSYPNIQSSNDVSYDQYDQFNTFNQGLDQQILSSVIPSAYTNAGIGGLASLAQYGRWIFDPSYGQVWQPNYTSQTWAPYRDGNWVWEDGYGWTWVSAEPWGWAPYHYGSWYQNTQHRWCWYPPRPARTPPAWVPAYVGFVNYNGGNNIGWVPLAPREQYHPWGPRYYRGRPYANNVTYITNYTNIRNVYRNVAYNGFTGVPRRDFEAGSFRRRTVVRPSELRGARIVRGYVPVVPSRANLRYDEHAAVPHVAVRPAAFTEHRFAGRVAPAARLPFAQQRVALTTGKRAAYIAPVVRNERVPAATARLEAHEPHALPGRPVAHYAAPARMPERPRSIAPAHAAYAAPHPAPHAATVHPHPVVPAHANYASHRLVAPRTIAPAHAAYAVPHALNPHAAAPRPVAPVHAYAAPHHVAPHPAAPVHAYVERHPVAPVHAYVAPRPVAPVRTYVAPRPAAPVHASVAPRPAAPVHTYVAPRPAAPVHTYVAPRPAVPARAYAPARPAAAHPAPARPAHPAHSAASPPR